MTNVKIFIAVIVILVIGTVITVLMRSTSAPAGPGKYDAFTQCIVESGAKFYGAFWCPHCQAQKKMFGSSAKLLPYVECSPLSGQGQFPICTEQGVESYPTWIFADGSRATGEVALDTLAKKTNCELPTEATQ